MDIRLKQRLVGAIVLVALAVIFIPMVLQSPEEVLPPATDMPTRPAEEFHDRFAKAVPEAPPPLAEPARQVMTPPEEPAATAPVAAPPVPAQAVLPPAAAEMSNAEAVVPEPAPAAQAGPGAWVVQLGVFGQEVNAQSLAKTLRTRGYTAFVERFAGKAGPSFRVRIGPVKDRAAADALRARLKREDKLVAIVKSYP